MKEYVCNKLLIDSGKCSCAKFSDLRKLTADSNEQQQKTDEAFRATTQENTPKLTPKIPTNNKNECLGVIPCFWSYVE